MTLACEEADEIPIGCASATHWTFWRVVAIQSNRHLSLRAEMRLPGAAILDFRISRQIAKGPGVSEEMLFALRSVERSSECSVF